MKVTGYHQFHLTRNSDLSVDEEEIVDLKHALEGELPARRYGSGVRLEAADNCPAKIADFLLKQFNLVQNNLYQVNGPVNLNRLMALPDLVDRPDLTFPGFMPGLPGSLTPNSNMFRRVETCFPIDSKKLQEQITTDLELYLSDNVQTWILDSSGNYTCQQPTNNNEPICAQTALLEQMAEKV